MPNAHPLSEIFAALEQGKTPLGIEDYSVSQTSLEDIFIRIAESDELPTAAAFVQQAAGRADGPSITTTTFPPAGGGVVSVNSAPGADPAPAAAAAAAPAAPLPEAHTLNSASLVELKSVSNI